MALLTSLLGLFGAALALPGCARTPKTPAVPITEVQQISFSKQGMARTAITNRTIRRTDQGAEIVLELWDGEEPLTVRAANESESAIWDQGLAEAKSIRQLMGLLRR